jgi:hypothetical protein
MNDPAMTCLDCPTWWVFWITVVVLLSAGLGALAVLRALRFRRPVAAWLMASPLIVVVAVLAYAAYRQLFGSGWHGSLLR